MRLPIVALLAVALMFEVTALGNPVSDSPPARGYQLLTTKPYLPPDFDQETFDAVWQEWPEALRARADQAAPEERRRMAFERYGFTVARGDDSGRPQQYVVDDNGQWTMNCLACHQGKVAGRVVPGVPNSLFALQTLTEEIRATKFRLGKRLSHMDVGSLFMPLGTSNGTTNSVNFGVALLAQRDPELNVIVPKAKPRMVHHDHDPPAWWLFKRKERLYSDGFALKGHRPLMQFMLVVENGPQKFREWEDDYKNVYEWLESLEVPHYPFKVDHNLATTGEGIFRQHCSRCHGTYGPGGSYPNHIVPLDEVATDPVRLKALTPAHRDRYGQSWFCDYGRDKVLRDPIGYIAPPLDGVWASAPYFHNGSVPTLWHVLHSDERPKVWLRTPDGYDRQHVGLEITELDAIPKDVNSNTNRRQYFDTNVLGKSAGGHRFPDVLDEPQKRAVLEYLKTL